MNHELVAEESKRIDFAARDAIEHVRDGEEIAAERVLREIQCRARRIRDDAVSGDHNPDDRGAEDARREIAAAADLERRAERAYERGRW